MSYSTKVVQVTNCSPSTTSEQMRTLFGFLGTIEELKLFPPDDSQMPVTSRVCFVKFQEPESVGVSQHLTNTVFVDRALIVVPFAEGSIPDEAKALSLLAPANAVAGAMPGGGLLPTPNQMQNQQMGGNPFGGPSMEAMAAFGFPGMGPNMNQQATEQFFKFMTDPKLNQMAMGMSMNQGMKPDSSREIEEAMKRVREAQSLISAAIEPEKAKDSKKKHSRSRSRSRKRRSRSKHRRSRSRSKRRSVSRSRRHTTSPRSRRRTPSPKDRGWKSQSRSRKKSRTPPKSYSTTRRSRSVSRGRRRRSRSASRSPRRSPRRKISRSPSPRRHKKDKKRDKERDRDRRSDKGRSRDERERSVSKKKRSKDNDPEQDRKSDGEKGDVKVTRDYDEEEQGYDSDKERLVDRKDSDDSAAASPHSGEGDSNGTERRAKVNGADDHQDEDDMDVSD